MKGVIFVYGVEEKGGGSVLLTNQSAKSSMRMSPPIEAVEKVCHRYLYLTFLHFKDWLCNSLRVFFLHALGSAAWLVYELFVNFDKMVLGIKYPSSVCL